MSQAQQGQTAIASVRSSKRKRAQINYYEGDDEFQDHYEPETQSQSQDAGKFSQPKKRKSTRPSRPSRPLPKRKIFPFLELPAEIRNMIYGYCLTDPHGVLLISATKHYRRIAERGDKYEYDRYLNSQNEKSESALEPRPLVPAILAVNKQIYNEGREMLYSNEFKFGDTLALHSFVANIGPRAASLLTDLTLKTWQYSRCMHKAYNHAAFAAMMAATNIKQFKFDCYLGCSSEPKSVARQVYRDGFPWLEAVGVAKGKIDAAVDLIEIRNDNFQGHYWRSRSQADPEEDFEVFKAELRKLLGVQMDRIRSTKKEKSGKA
ncbi:hypothetical protein K469DRAFT_624877 [Zopfia rhizophila CBS 207.26]|uniref:DUF7730 domain-containing protein n=1 Tax=Zopfia rhizophila CBS 207.26 TaxID=1314779 RepID=A0A6A6EHD0_9PEZI|nr:hypothetical protein K469DRAFT_624877 [Zopfia rhizophila CBS 207.26]